MTTRAKRDKAWDAGFDDYFTRGAYNPLYSLNLQLQEFYAYGYQAALEQAPSLRATIARLEAYINPAQGMA